MYLIFLPPPPPFLHRTSPSPHQVILYYFHRMPSAMDWMVDSSCHEDKMALTRLLGSSKDGKVSAEMIENSIRRLSILQARRQGSSSVEGHKGEEAA